jgi:hypothetical protein
MSVSGVSLVEVLVVSAIALAIMAGLSAFMIQSNRGSLSVKAMADFTSLISVTQMLVNRPETCKKALEGILLNKNDPTPLPQGLRTQGPNGAVVIPGPGSMYGNRLKITQLEFGPLILAAGNVYSTSLNLRGERQVGGGVMGGAEVRHSFPLILGVNFSEASPNTGGQVVSCGHSVGFQSQTVAHVGPSEVKAMWPNGHPWNQEHTSGDFPNKTETIAVPAGATHLSFYAYCHSLGKNSSTWLDMQFLDPSSSVVHAHRGCYLAGVDDHQGSALEVTHLLPIPTGVTQVKFLGALSGTVICQDNVGAMARHIKFLR